MRLFNKLPLLILCFLGITISSYSQINEGKGFFEFSDSPQLQGKKMRIYYYRPGGDIKQMPILFVMHGVLRNADDYRDNWVELADKYKILIISPEFSKELFLGNRAYNYGNLLAKDKSLNKESDWSFSLIDPIFEKVLSLTGSQQKKFDLFGHSAGSQFVHRFFIFKGSERANQIMTANAGSYTFLDENIPFPFGIKDMGFTNTRLKKLLQKPLIVQLGEADTSVTDKYLSKDIESMKQGAFRFERGNHFYNYAKSLAEKLGVPFNWKLRTVPGVAHDNARMAIDAAKYLYGKN